MRVQFRHQSFLRSCLSYVIILAALLPGCGTTTNTIASYPVEPRQPAPQHTISVISDTQSPLWFETLWIRADDNETATRSLLQDIATDSNCAALFHLGDITALGSIASFWSDFDERTVHLRQHRIPLYPAFGNHEYMPFPNEGRDNFLQRFAFADRSWYFRKVGSIAFILLNSNFSRLDEEEIQSQQEWYENTFRALDADTSVQYVLVGCHHSPYTNSTIVDPSEDVQHYFVPAFQASKKGVLFLSGHSHAFERFRNGGKDYVVLGGGGGLLHPLLTGEHQRWPDHFPHDDNRSFFHYLRILETETGLTVELRRWNGEGKIVMPAYRFNVTRQ